tara:strand:- start:350 stop:568 length:219 start_codon:yes stop_codon:yes gene_type:complete
LLTRFLFPDTLCILHHAKGGEEVDGATTEGGDGVLRVDARVVVCEVREDIPQQSRENGDVTGLQRVDVAVIS